MTISKLAKKWAKNGSYEAEIYQAYIDNVGEEYATAEECEEAYQGEYESDEAFAMQLADDCGFETPNNWPYNCIDWEQASRDIMYDYFESNGYYFRNL
jgi:antirestriction protein